MKKETLLLVVIGMLIGVLLAVIFFNMQNRQTPTVGNAGTAPPPAPTVNYQQQIQMLKGLLAKEPDNRNAWVQLGNNYFDANQPMDAVEAYDRALQLQPDDPNILTDQGAMYRRLGWYDKAIANFEQANRLNPNHQQSLYNLGIVYRYDLQDFEKAIEAWEKFLVLSGDSPATAKVRSELEFMKNHPAIPQPQ